MLTNIIKIISGIFFLVCILLLVIYFVFGIDIIAQHLGFDPNCISLIESNRERVLTYTFSLKERIWYLIAGIGVLAGIFFICFIKASQLTNRLKAALIFFREYTVQSYYGIKKSNAKFFLLISIAVYIYYAFTAPITHDEATTYTRFVYCSLLNTMAGYTLPNNHILYSIIEHLFIKIPFVDLIFKFRLPSILISFLTWVIAYRFVKKYANEKTAVTVVAITSTVYMILQYSFFARGYSLLVLFSVLCLYAAYNIIQDNNRLRDWTIFSLSGILGFYTMPSFLYPFLTVNIFILCFNYKHILKQIRFNLYIVAGVFILYLPILIVLGWEALSGNNFVKPLDRGYVISVLPEFFNTALRQIFAIPPYILVPALIILAVYSAIKRDLKTFMLWLICFITPFILLTIHSVIPFHRTFVYYGFLLVFLPAITLRKEINKISMKILIVLLIGIQAFQIYRFNHKLDHLTAYYAEYEDTIDLTIEDNKSYLTNALYLYPNYLFEIDRRHFKSTIDMNLTEINSDTLKRYDIVLLDSLLDKTRDNTPCFKVEDFRNIPINIYYPSSE